MAARMRVGKLGGCAGHWDRILGCPLLGWLEAEPGAMVLARM